MAKNIKTFLNERADYDNIRRLLRHTYLYGTYSKTDFIESGLINAKGKAMNDYFQIIINYLDQLTLYSSQSENSSTAAPLTRNKKKFQDRASDKVGLTFSKDPAKFPSNYLAWTFRQHTISNDTVFFFLYFMIIFSLEDGENPYDIYGSDDNYNFDLSTNTSEYIDSALEELSLFSVNIGFTADEIYNLICVLYNANSHIVSEAENRTIPDLQMPYSKYQCETQLNKLTELGVLIISGTKDPYDSNSGEKGRPKEAKNKYRLSKSLIIDIQQDIFSPDFLHKLEEITDLSEFYYNHAPIGLPGYFISEKTASIRSSLNDFEQYNPSDSLLFINHNFQNIIDDDVLYSILQIIHKKGAITYEYQTDTASQMQNYKVIPLKIMIDSTYGRHYLLSKNCKHKGEKYLLHRIDSIFNVMEDTVPDNMINSYNDEELKKLINDCWNVSVSSAPLNPVLLHFSFDETPLGRYQEERFLSMAKGTIKSIDEAAHLYDFRIEVTNPTEMIPMINSYGSFVTVDQETCPQLYAAINTQANEALSLYESV